MRERLSALVDALGARAFWIVLGGTAAVLIGLAGWTGWTALERAEAWREQAATTARAEALVRLWTRELEPATAAESAAWQASAAAAAERGIEARDRVALLQAVAEEAEALGIDDLVLNFVPADTLDALADRELEGSVFEPAPFALTLSGIAETGTLLRLVHRLPPQVELVRLDAVAVPEGVEARLTMLVYLGTGANGDAR